MSAHSVELAFSPALVDAIAEAVAEKLTGAVGGIQTPSPLLNVDEAAGYLRADRQRVYDLVHAGSLTPLRDGRRLLFSLETIIAYLEGRAA